MFIDILTAALTTTAVPILVYMLVMNLSELVIILAAATRAMRHSRLMKFTTAASFLSSPAAPGISVIVPMFNEAAGIRVSSHALLSLRYPRHEVILVDDGSSDDTFEVLRAEYDLVEVRRTMPNHVRVRRQPDAVFIPRDGATRLTVVRKANSGRSDSLNVGTNFATGDICVFTDADSILDPDALIHVARPFAEDPLRMVAVGGAVRVVNGCTLRNGDVSAVRVSNNPLAAVQVVEYLRAYHIGRSGWATLDMLLLISGAFGVFRRDILTAVGGLDPDSIGEDFELTLRIHDYMRRQGTPYRIGFAPEAACWTEVPSTLRVLARQRSRWHRGLWETLLRHRRMAFNPRYGKVGMLALPYYWIFELFAPLLEAYGYLVVGLGLVFGLVHAPYMILFASVAWGTSLIVALSALAIEELAFPRYHRWRDVWKFLGAAVFEQIGFRQLHLVWRLDGWAKSLLGREQKWGVMTRAGFTTADD